MKRNDVPTVEDIRVVETCGPWETKSGGQLEVLFALSLNEVWVKCFGYRDEELDRIPKDIRGLRAYIVRGLPEGGIGGKEFHRIREELVFVLAGSMLWVCEDLFGGRKEFILDPSVGIWMPPFIMHTCTVLEEDSVFLIVANTLFDPDDPRTHDTYSREAFRELQTEHMKPG